MSIEDRLLTIERLLRPDDLDLRVTRLEQQLRDAPPGGGGACPVTSFYAEITAASSGKYSFESVLFAGDGSASPDTTPSAVVGVDTDPDGYALESDSCVNVPVGTIALMTLQETGNIYVFSYQFTVLARTKVLTSYPAVAGAYYGCETQVMSGTPGEGGPATVTTNGDTFLAFNVGTRVPPQGTSVICSRTNVDTTATPQRPYWTFSYSG